MVEFPGLWDLKLSIRREAVENLFGIDGFSIYWYGVIIALGFMLAVLLGVKNSRKFGLEPDNILDMILFAAPAAIVGARLFYVIFTWELFRDNPMDILNTRKGGLAIYGGLIAGMITAYIYCRYKKINPFKLLDFGVPYVAMAQGIGRWGNFFNQEAFGVPTNLPWRMNGDIINQYLTGLDLSAWGAHPTFLYESLWDFAVFFFLIWFRNRKKKDGEVLCLYMVAYGVGRFFIEGLRTDSLMLGASGLRISQVLAALFAIVFIVLFVIIRKRTKAKAAEAELEASVAAASEGASQSVYSELLSKIKEESMEHSNETVGHSKETVEHSEETVEHSEGSGQSEEVYEESPEKDDKKEDTQEDK